MVVIFCLVIIPKSLLILRAFLVVESWWKTGHALLLLKKPKGERHVVF